MRVGDYRVSPDVATRVRAGHPWVFRDALGPRGVAEPTGAVIDLISGNREFVGRGYVDRDHAIAVRVLTRNPDERVVPGNGIVAARFARAVQLRWLQFGAARPAAMRVFSGESEGLPGVTVDRYGDFVVVQWLSAGALAWRDELYDAIEKALSPSGIYEQKRLRPLGGQAVPEPAVRARGDEAPLEIVVDSRIGNDVCKFGVDVTAPMGVGLFPDMRLGWAAVASRAADRRVLNLFSYTGAFSVHAAKAGAREVVAVDLAPKAHARARRNYELSGLDPARLEAITGDTTKSVEKLATRGRRFDIVICDPPTFSHGPAGQFSVSRDLAPLAATCLSVLEPGGFLVFATNSTKVSAPDFDRALGEGGALAGADLRVIERVGLPVDYPVAPGFPEGNYLKLAICLRA
ncbi:MAG TPA: class I SAM-dependent rRNA methyltransferase [Polyangia bacterium]|jgi:23S rRNA (cytosine1962-C5)-methyltransferase|nr:class I SAM-dependent rRNA methyltransferase [Polyangia bacterium]